MSMPNLGLWLVAGARLWHFLAALLSDTRYAGCRWWVAVCRGVGKWGSALPLVVAIVVVFQDGPGGAGARLAAWHLPVSSRLRDTVPSASLHRHSPAHRYTPRRTGPVW